MEATRHLLIAQLVIDLMTGGVDSDDTNLSEQAVSLIVAQKHAEAIERQWYQAKNLAPHEDGTPAASVVSFNLPLLNDLDQGCKYAILLQRLISLPGNRGLVNVSALGGKPYVLCLPSQVSAHVNSRSARFDGRLVACLLGDIISIHRPTNSPIDYPEEITVSIVASDSKVVDASLESFIVSETMKLLTMRRRADLVSDNVEDNPRA